MSDLIIKLPQGVSIDDIKKISITTYNNKSFDIYTYVNTSEILFINLSSHNIQNIDEFMFNLYKFDNNIICSKKISIDISNNKISNNLFKEIINVIDQDFYKERLCILNISFNRICQDGIKLLFEFIKKCHCFQELNCDVNFFTKNQFNNTIIDSNLSEEYKNKFTYSAY